MKKKGIGWPEDQLLFPDSDRYIVMDVETMNPYADIIQLAAVEVIDLEIKRHIFTNIKPLCKTVSYYCANVHGITLKDVKHEKTFLEFSTELVSFVGDSPIIAHNRPAEYKSLLFEFEQVKEPFPFDIGNFYCSMKMAKGLGLNGRLRNMAEQVGIQTHHLRREHDALSDTLIASELFIKMKKFMIENN